ncbi:type II toxin-antitoxin system HicB family antitoxin [Candidatus Poriferisodalis sp.]|uniref:type II toxin-antitoxin system HicB family antitoxin n=1 Tax=Candidatus Poriferisodalis sp. TaxID=3101277 RepID=UPI003C6EC991
MKLTYAVVIEQISNNCGAYAPDVPGCISTAETPDEMLANIREALAFHLDGLARSGDPVPVPAMSVDDAIAYHVQALADSDAELLADYGDAAATLSTRFETVEVEISTP